MWPTFHKVESTRRKKSGKEHRSKTKKKEHETNGPTSATPSKDKECTPPISAPPPKEYSPLALSLSVEKPDLNDPNGRKYKRPSEQAWFNPDAYLRDFYADTHAEPAMTVVMLFMPNIVVRLPSGIRTMLDVGSGPTVHMAMLFRHKVEEIYLSDYAEANVGALRSWMAETSKFDWASVKKYIAYLEGEEKASVTMEQVARGKVKGAYKCDIFEETVLVEGPLQNDQFDIVTSTFCTEAACTTGDKYAQGIRNITSKIRPGGYLVMAGILQETWYQYDYQRYHCFYLSEEDLFENLEKNGIDLTEGNYSFTNHQGIFIISARKHS